VGRIWVLVLCAACARGTGAGGAGAGEESSFSVSYPDAPATGTSAPLRKRFYAKPEGRCLYDNGREARWTIGGARVVKGELPPGLTLEDGVIGGVPTQMGTYRFQIELSNITCAGKPYEGQAVDVQITVK
jgi:hypothetical protein